MRELKLTDVCCTRVVSSCIVTSASVLCCLSNEFSESNLIYYIDNCIVRKHAEWIRKYYIVKMYRTWKNIDPNCAIEGLYINLQTESLRGRKHQIPLYKSSQFSLKNIYILRVQDMICVRINKVK